MTTVTNTQPSELPDLEFVKLKFPRLIPNELIEAVKGRTFTPEQFYNYQEKQVRSDNPNNLLFALVSKEKKIYGYLWCEINGLDNSMFVNTFSVAKEFWHKGKIIPQVTAFLADKKAQYKCPLVFWCTTNEKFFLKHGFKRSKNMLMEYRES